MKLICLCAVCVQNFSPPGTYQYSYFLDSRYSESLYNEYEIIFSNCRRILGEKTWGRVQAALEMDSNPQVFPDMLFTRETASDIPAYLADLARIEWELNRIKNNKAPFRHSPESVTVNPYFTLLPVSWKNLASLMEENTEEDHPVPAQALMMIWRHSKTGKMYFREAEEIDLLALKITIEKIDPREAASIGNIPVGAINSALERAIRQGIIIAPDSRIKRVLPQSTEQPDNIESFLTARTFTLQWHITQSCDLRCKHCYDRSDRAPLSRDTAMAILDDFYSFCRSMNVKGQVTFTGGNPILYPYFPDIYEAAWKHGFGVAILGNPAPIEQIERLIDIAKPLFFQISMEGLAQYNDYIRGEGHFKRSLAFLDQLRQLDIYTMVMLTLSRDNLDQVLPLGHLLLNRADYFTFNRLVTVGEGAQLAMPLKNDFEDFLRKYEVEARSNPVLGLKDNLINILREEKGIEPFGGCTGYGCGAAFNFVALLPDGEVHACRKFPSPIGNILQTSLLDIYHSELSRKYREGSEACCDCSLFSVCRGCFAIAYSYGLDVFKEKDPFCFKKVHYEG